VVSAVWSQRHPDLGFTEIQLGVSWTDGLASGMVCALEEHGFAPSLFTITVERTDLADVLACAASEMVTKSETIRVSVADALSALPPLQLELHAARLAQTGLKPTSARSQCVKRGFSGAWLMFGSTCSANKSHSAAWV
jgi:hypothetical protein